MPDPVVTASRALGRTVPGVQASTPSKPVASDFHVEDADNVLCLSISDAPDDTFFPISRAAVFLLNALPADAASFLGLNSGIANASGTTLVSIEVITPVSASVVTVTDPTPAPVCFRNSRRPSASFSSPTELLLPGVPPRRACAKSAASAFAACFAAGLLNLALLLAVDCSNVLSTFIAAFAFVCDK